MNLYTSSIMQTPAFAHIMGRRVEHDGVPRIYKVGCIDGALPPEIQFNFKEGYAFVHRTAAAHIGKKRTRAMEHELTLVSGDATKENFIWEADGHDLCLAAGNIVEGVLGDKPFTTELLREMLGHTEALDFIRALRSSALKLPDLKVAATTTITLNSCLNIARYDVVQQHIDSAQASIVPAHIVFQRGTGHNNPTGYPFIDDICVFSPVDGAFGSIRQNIGKANSWLDRGSKDNKRTSAGVLADLQNAYVGFVGKIAHAKDIEDFVIRA